MCLALCRFLKGLQGQITASSAALSPCVGVLTPYKAQHKLLHAVVGLEYDPAQVAP